jgi:hypothetical protein
MGWDTHQSTGLVVVVVWAVVVVELPVVVVLDSLPVVVVVVPLVVVVVSWAATIVAKEMNNAVAHKAISVTMTAVFLTTHPRGCYLPLAHCGRPIVPPRG